MVGICIAHFYAQFVNGAVVDASCDTGGSVEGDCDFCVLALTWFELHIVFEQWLGVDYLPVWKTLL
jgi:hypothetical protein